MTASSQRNRATHRRPVRGLGALIGATAVLTAVVPVLVAGPAGAADPVTFLPNNGVATTYTVPAGVTSVQIRAIGGSGANGGSVGSLAGGVGGKGDVVETTITVQPGQALAVVVGENGGAGGSPDGGLGGFPGSLASFGGRGGGSSRVLGGCADASCVTPAEVWAAGGGGGGGRGDTPSALVGGAGAASNQAAGGNGGTGSGLAAAGGGRTATATAHGLGGASGEPAICGGSSGPDGGAGNGAQGGAGGGGGGEGGGGGGGGGGGYRTGGGGGGGGTLRASTVLPQCAEERNGGGGGGGAGFSVVLGGSATTIGVDTTSSPRVVITPLGDPVDTTAPTVTVEQAAGQADPASGLPVTFTATFSEPVSGLSADEVVVTGPSTGRIVGVTPMNAGTLWRIEVSGITEAGVVTASIPAGVATDAAGNGNVASTSTDNSVTFAPGGSGDTTPPTVTVDQAGGQADPASTLPITFVARFSELVSGFTSDDVVVTGPSAGRVVSVAPLDAGLYAIYVTGITEGGVVTVSIPAGVVTDEAGNGNVASTSTDNSVTFSPPPVPVAPTYAVADLTVTEGDGGRTSPKQARVVVTRSGDVSSPGSVHLYTQSGTSGARAISDQDFKKRDTVVDFPAGVTSVVVQVAVIGDLIDEPKEVFRVVIDAPVGGTVADHLGLVTIVDDD